MLTLKSREFFPNRSLRPVENVSRKMVLDSGLVLLLTILSALMMANFNFSETIVTWLRAHENFQMDEWPGALLILTSSLIWFGLRRQHDLKNALEAHRLTEAELAEQLRTNQKLHLDLFHVQERERAHLAQEVHDELGQYLSTLRLDLHGLKSQDPSNELLGHAESSLAHMQLAVRQLLHELKPVALEELGLPSALEHLVSTWQTRLPDISWGLVIEPKDLDLDKTLAMTLYRITQEALTNIAKHSNAHQVKISLARHLDEIELTIVDDGLGVDLSTPLTGFGLSGMNERVRAINGQFDYSSGPGLGFAIEVRLPVEES